MHDKGSKGVCKMWLCAMHDQSMKNAHVGQGVLNTQPMNQTCFQWGNMRNPKVWYSSESKQVRKCLKGILSNTWRAHYKQQCKTIHKHHEIHPWYMFFCHKGPTSKAKHQKKPIRYKNLIKIKFSQPLWWKSQPRVQNSPKHNLRIKINEKSLELP